MMGEMDRDSVITTSRNRVRDTGHVGSFIGVNSFMFIPFEGKGCIRRN